MAVPTFGTYLKNISLSIDIVNDETFKRVKEEMEDYFKKLDIKFFEFLVPANIEDKPGLKTVWHTGGDNWNKKLKDANGKYQGQISYSYDLNKKLCIVAASGGKLSKAKSFINQWKAKGQKIELPKYVYLSDDPTYASVMIPAAGKTQNKIGIFNFEFGQKIEITVDLQDELKILTEAFANIYVLNKANITQRENTAEVLKTLRERDGFTTDFKKPFIFVASSSRCDKLVYASIKTVLSNYDTKVRTEFWDASSNSGSIPDEIQKYISECTYGVCYLSEKASEGSEPEYRDNANVLFEAGMIHALKGGDRWIPIREADELTDPPPFDIASLRHVLVVRDENGDFDKISKKKFQEELGKQIESLIGDQN